MDHSTPRLSSVSCAWPESRSSAARLMPRSRLASSEVPKRVSVRQKTLVASRVRNSSPTGMAQRSRARVNAPGGSCRSSPAPMSPCAMSPSHSRTPQLRASAPERLVDLLALAGEERRDGVARLALDYQAEPIEHAVQARHPEVRAEVRGVDGRAAALDAELVAPAEERSRSLRVERGLVREEPVEDEHRREEPLGDEGVARVEPVVVELLPARPFLARLLGRGGRGARGLRQLPGAEACRETSPGARWAPPRAGEGRAQPLAEARARAGRPWFPAAAFAGNGLPRASSAIATSGYG